MNEQNNERRGAYNDVTGDFSFNYGFTTNVGLNPNVSSKGKQVMVNAREERVCQTLASMYIHQRSVQSNLGTTEEKSRVWKQDKRDNTCATNHMISKVRMLTKESNLYTSKVREIGREDNGLYLLLKGLTQSQLQHHACGVKRKNEKEGQLSEEGIHIWHKRLGHMSSHMLKKLFPVCANILKEKGIVHQKLCPYAPQQNEVVERKHRQVLEVTRALRFQGCIPLRYWGQCVIGAAYLINKMPSRVLGGVDRK
ncbi:hypothetical protein KY284_020286 [Solanum tuberosum]|nr:hypothetical protein KY284_020286 [Solanum tuberosum]